MTTHNTRIVGRVCLALFLLLALGADGRARDPGSMLRGPRSASQEEQRSGIAMVSAVDVAGRTLTIGDEDYAIDDDTKIHRSSGMMAELDDIRAPEPKPNQLIALDQVDFVRYTAKRAGRHWVMESIEILDEVPE